jgi:hypothetical protein
MTFRGRRNVPFGPRWVNRAILTVGQSLPVYRDQPIFSEYVGMSQRRHIQTHALQQLAFVYSITSSARASSEGGMARPSALAVFRLTASSNLLEACVGRSAGFAPFRTRSI